VNASREDEGRRPIRELDPATVAQRATDGGGTVLYLRQALYPVVRAEAVLLERSRDEMGEIERTMLALCGCGLSRVEEIAFAMGLKVHRLRSLLTEIEHRGLVVRDMGGAYAPSTLGKMSLDRGAEVIRSRHAVILCGITGRLLPAAAYAAPLLERSEIGDRRYLTHDVIAEAESIPLTGLQLEHIEAPRSVNLPEETVQIEGLLPASVRPGFMRAVLALVRAENGSSRCELHLGSERATIHWLSLDQALGLLEPLGFPVSTPESTLGVIDRGLEELGVLKFISHLDPFGNPAVEISDVAGRFMEVRIDGRSPILKVGTDGFAAVPLGQFFVALGSRRVDVLRGRTLSLSARGGSSFARLVRVLRVLERAHRDHRRRRPPIPKASFVRRSLSEAGLEAEEARAAVAMVALPWLGDGLDDETSLSSS
jgi:hypothetical protein